MLAHAPSPASAQFQMLAQRFLDERHQESPTSATSAGLHQLDHLMDDMSAEAHQASLSSLKTTRAQVEALPEEALPLEFQVDRSLLLNAIERGILELEEVRSWEWNPLVYAQLLGGGLFSLISRDFAPLPERMESVIARLRQVPRVLTQAQQNLQQTCKIHVETAIGQNIGLEHLIDRDLRTLSEQVSPLSAAFDEAAQLALRALHAHGQWLKTEGMARANRKPQLGRELWERKLSLTLESDFTADEVLARAHETIHQVRGALYELAVELLGARGGSRFPAKPDEATRRQVIHEALELANGERVDASYLLQEIRQAVQECERFARTHDLITLPEEPLDVIELPEFMKGVGVAYCASPGPYERHLKTYYMASPPPSSWSPAQAESFLREYNVWMLRNLSVHEAIPGHYVQLAHANRHPSVLRAILASGTFVEGWAVYSEKLMADLGFADDLRLKLMQLKMQARVSANAILDQWVHVYDRSEADAMQLMVEDTFQEEREAAGKWRRAQLTACQLSTYFVGLQEWLTLRRDAEAAAAAQNRKLHLRLFHDRALSYGSPPMRLVRKLLQADGGLI